MATIYGYELTPNIVLIGVPDKAALVRASEQCREYEIPHHVWREPDFDYGLTAIATAAISGSKREAFAQYRLWKEFSAISSTGRATDSNSVGSGIVPQMALHGASSQEPVKSQ